MAEDDFLNPDDFPIVTANGAYLTFDDGYVRSSGLIAIFIICIIKVSFLFFS
jgi:hypothetical protein